MEPCQILNLAWRMYWETNTTSIKTIKVSPCIQDVTASTKRKVMLEASKVFDPLSLYLPVTVRSRILRRELWRHKLDWDDVVPEDWTKVWRTLAKDLLELDSIPFPRRVLNQGKSANLFLFCDASKIAYDFAAYVVQDGHSTLAKVTSLENKSLPTLELLCVPGSKVFPFLKGHVNRRRICYNRWPIWLAFLPKLLIPLCMQQAVGYCSDDCQDII